MGFLVGLGFGISEFFVYVFFYGAPVLIRIPGIFFHAASMSVIAYGIGSNKTTYFYLVAVFLHFSTNFLSLL